MGVHVGDGHVVTDPRIAHRERRQVLTHGGVPLHNTFADLLGNHGGSDRLGQRRDLKDGVGVHFAVLADLPDAETLGEGHLPAADNCHREAGDLRLRHDALGELGHPVDGVIDLLLAHRHSGIGRGRTREVAIRARRFVVAPACGDHENCRERRDGELQSARSGQFRHSRHLWP